MSCRAVTPETLSQAVEFDCPFQVHEDGVITTRPGIDTPEMFLNEAFTDCANEWELISGFSGQDRYSGPVMHNSEYLGGAMAEYVLDNPGIYVLMPAEWDDEETPYSEKDGFYIEGWVLARLRYPDEED